MKQVHRDHAELEQRPALQEQDAVVVGNEEQLAEVGLGRVNDCLKGLRAVADLKDRNARARQGQQIAPGLFKNGQGQNSRSRREIIHAVFHHRFLERQEHHSEDRLDDG